MAGVEAERESSATLVNPAVSSRAGKCDCKRSAVQLATLLGKVRTQESRGDGSKRQKAMGRTPEKMTQCHILGDHVAKVLP